MAGEVDEHDGEVRCGGRQAGAVEQAVDRAPDGLDGGVDLVGVRQVDQVGFVDGAAARLDVEPVDLGPEGGQDRRSRCAHPRCSAGHDGPGPFVPEHVLHAVLLFEFGGHRW